MRKVILTILGVLALQGCSSSSIKPDGPANVTSTPTAAMVFANGVKLGQTPLRYNLYEAFPTGWNNWVLSATGVLMIKKEGCEDYSLQVNDYILSKPIHAELKCSEENQAEKVDSVVHEVKPASPPANNRSVSDIEKRLTELEVLFKNGVITSEEYKTTRMRILGDL